MSETMYDCYTSQFTCMRNIMLGRKELLHAFGAFYRALNPDRIYLVGSGTSYNACGAAATFMEKILAVEVTTVAPSAIGKLYGNRPLMIAVSQSGQSTNTLHAIEPARKAGVAVVTLTDPTDTPVGRSGDLAVHLAADNELVGPKTRGYTGTILLLHLMALEAALHCAALSKGDYEQTISAYGNVCEQEQAYLQTCQNFYDAHFSDLKNARAYIFSGKGADAMTAKESALKVLETLCFPSLGYEYEEVLHGPLCCVDESTALFLYLSHDEDKERMLKTADIIGRVTPNCYVVTDDPTVMGEKILSLPASGSECTSVFTYILFSQLISAKLTQDLGRTRHPGVMKIFESMGTKMCGNNPTK